MPRLEIELVPATSWFDNVRTRVSTQDWNRCKNYVRARSKNRCQICGGRGAKWPVECHEIWHYDDDTHTQTLKGLIALCPKCHEVKHIGLASVRGRLVPALAHLARTNGWSNEDAGHYVEWAFELWNIRSTEPWTVDVSWLRTLNITDWSTEPRVPQEARKMVP